MQEYIEFFQQNMILSLAWVGILGALILNIFKSSTAKYQSISVNELTYLVNKENGIVLDIRSKDEFRQGHITDSVNLLPSEIKSGSYGSLENQKSTPIIVVCKSGQTAQESANLLAKAGFEKVSLLKNGLVAWNEANLPLVRGKK
ncbi:rhodanese-like domain-containing protein [Vibrio mangrovi]|uniref:Rhodanese-like domain-containing protein n=1 Tax=Vibrio mangrovi TaxID=474394 RepID=A0A1Y6J1L4_9VIBR|nr:rhodanese-like domain-containing protein [Vibrio mangrovi]MDW6002722.1 rhodanese-like domain-containing protein [Vibrio mangrovi]SMS02213.1 Thiosulfate sulfurtransferase GlpE [Vibrio mangrovi]